ncbi:hydrolase [Paenibacillus baekrokdamisoli]|uniref:Hydrolase n=1 Tax=Paenibacillus baekrokdamisoli TaxID=1712516 RepID=A0A3G9JIC3_9BACL|nr:alpha/beta hydrolase [Paenibacillus baekrokdamisoli]MBB3068223.1 acetyl esterase/lipase [Paenibacillus baekrokdamisoli]BBH22734.1 hydrolase [Paenibacillus baekrokdamisoli]
MEITNVEQLAAIKGYLKQTSSYEGKSVEQIRNELAEAASKWPPLPNITIEKTTIGHLQGEWVRSAAASPTLANRKQAVLYLHGGGFIAGTCEFYRDLAARISFSSGVDVLTIEYRLAPEHPYPAANEDCLSAYRWLLKNGYSGRHIVLGGDSVGASLALMTLISLRDNGEELPACAFLLSPHTDLVNLDGESYRSRAELDPTGSRQGNQRILDAYLAGWEGEMPPLLSPLRMELRGLPELLIQVGDQEVLLSDALRFADRAKEADVDVTLEVWENMWSVFQALAYMLPEAQQAIVNIGQYVQERLNK